MSAYLNMNSPIHLSLHVYRYVVDLIDIIELSRLQCRKKHIDFDLSYIYILVEYYMITFSYEFVYLDPCTNSNTIQK